MTGPPPWWFLNARQGQRQREASPPALHIEKGYPDTYLDVRSSIETCTFECVTMECNPHRAGEDFVRMGLILVCVPAKHFWSVVDADVLTVPFCNLGGLGDQIVSVYEADVVLVNQFVRQQVIEENSELLISGFL